jgi:hypothetical protein
LQKDRLSIYLSWPFSEQVAHEAPALDSTYSQIKHIAQAAIGGLEETS